MRLAKEYRETILKVCYMFARDPEQVKDLAQEILLNLWSALPSFEGRSSLRTWVWKVSLYTCISNKEQTKKQQILPPPEFKFDLFNEEDVDALQIKELHKRINKLGLVDRAVIMLWLENMSYRDIGLVMGISEKSVSMRLHRIRERLMAME